MATCVELPNRAALVEHLYRSHELPLPFENLEIKPYFMEPDTRIGWDQTYIVTLEGFGPIGFTDESGGST
jgi:hypothetical protein